MKKTRITAILALVLICTLLLPGLASAATVKLAYKGGSLNLRSGPGTGYKSLGYVFNGDHISIVKYGDVWTKVRTDNGKTGYLKNLYIINGDDDYASGTTYFTNHYTAYTTAEVNFRAGAGTNTTSMGVLKKGAELRVHGKNGNWLLVEDSKGAQGYVHSNYVTEKAPATMRTVTGAYVNVRSGGGMSKPVIAVLTKGTKVEQLYRGNYWTQIQYKNIVGWINNAYIK